MSETATRVLVVMVIVGAVVIVLATGLLAFMLFQRHSERSTVQATATSEALPTTSRVGADRSIAAANALPDGAHATAVTLSGDRMGILYDRPTGGQGIVVVGPDGTVLLRLDPLAP